MKAINLQNDKNKTVGFKEDYKMKSNMRTRTTLWSALTGAVLMTAGQQALAGPVNKTLEFTCPFPLIGDQVISANIQADYPDEIVIADNPVLGPIAINVITTVPDKARQGLAFVDATTITGTASSINTFRTLVGNIDNTTLLTLERTEIPMDESGPFDVPASGTADAVTFDSSHEGSVSLTVDDLVLNMKNYKANGQLAPAPVGEFTADCTLIEGQDTTLTTFTVVGDGPVIVDDPAEIDVPTSAIDFGSLQLGQSASRTLTVTNQGDLPLGISNVSVTGDSAFTETNNCNSVAGGQSCAITLTYTAAEEGTQSATLVIESTDEDESVINIPLSGTGQVELTAEISVNPASLDFGTVTIGESSTKTVTVSNTGGAALTVNQVTLAGDAFTKASDTCGTVNPGASCSIGITYAPVEAASSTGSLVILSDDIDTPTVNVTFAGTGKEKDTGGFILDVNLAVNGSSIIAANGGTIPLSGDILTRLNLSTGDFTGDMHLNPTSGSFEVISGWSRYRATAQIEFESVGETVGSLVDGKLVATSQAYIKLPKVTKTLFGLIDWPIGGGDDCRTSEPVTFTVESPDDQPFDAILGGVVTGSYTLPPLENCGLLTSILNLKMEGPGNTINLEMAPVLD